MIRVRQLKLLVEKDTDKELKMLCSKKLRIDVREIKKINIIRKSIDARSKPVIYYSYVVDVLVKNEKYILKKFSKDKDVCLANLEEYSFLPKGNKKLIARPIIVGCGPCGLFCGYMLAKYGYRPIIIDRGESIDDRCCRVEEFWEKDILNINSNVLFGEGGAGTFSDGKLNTLIKDKNNYQRKVFEILVENGANDEIMYDAKPHIGTDKLRVIVKNIRNKIISMGGEVRFNSCLTDINIDKNKISSVVINNDEVMACQVLVLAIGHSARDTFEMLYNKKIVMMAKPFSVGVRIQHPQEMINFSQYGVLHHPLLKEACYKLTYTTSDKRGVYTFCMCPGGYVVNAASEEGGICINGMSNYKRESGNANSAVVVTVSPCDYGTNPLDGVKFQRNLERKAYRLGKGKIPVSLLKDYMNNKKSLKFGKVRPIFKGSYEFANINDIFPEYINKSLKEGIKAFDKKIKGYAREDAIVAAVEARTSSPVRIIRDEEGVSNILGIYPSGEGAGYAGGITTSAIDGIITFEKIANEYEKF